MIIENRIDAGRRDVRAEVRQRRAVVAQQKPRAGQDRAQFFHRNRQQEIVAEIAATVVSGKQYAVTLLFRVMALASVTLRHADSGVAYV